MFSLFTKHLQSIIQRNIVALNILFSFKAFYLIGVKFLKMSSSSFIKLRGKILLRKGCFNDGSTESCQISKDHLTSGKWHCWQCIPFIYYLVSSAVSSDTALCGSIPIISYLILFLPAAPKRGYDWSVIKPHLALG